MLTFKAGRTKLFVANGITMEIQKRWLKIFGEGKLRGFRW